MATKEHVDGSSKIYHPFQNEGMNYTAFSRCFANRKENTELLLEAMSYNPDRSRYTWVDIGSGNGSTAQIVKGMTEIFLREVTMWNVDPDPYAQEQAEKDTPSTERFRAYWIVGFGQDIETLLMGQIPEEGVDIVTMIDTIHEFPPDDQAPIIKAGARILKPRGVLGIITKFTDIATAGYESLWSRPAVRAAKKFGNISKAEQPGLLRRPPEEYTQMGEAAGLKLVYYKVVPVTYPTQALVDINGYPGWVEGVRKSFVFEQGEPSLEDFSRELQLSYGRTQPLPRNSVRYILQKPS